MGGVTTHGHTVHGRLSRTYRSWANMKSRCLSPVNKRFHDYGERGIRVCERWLDFQNFLSDMGPCPEGLTLERIDNDGNYEPGNCRWVTRYEQDRNKRTNVFLEHDGERRTLTDWARLLNTSHTRLAYYLRVRNMSVSNALARCRVPPQQGHPSKLTAMQVQSIRADTRSQRKIAAAFGISQSVVWRVKSGK